MPSLLTSRGVVLATVMAVSSTLIFFALRGHKPFSPTQFDVGQNSSSMLQNLPSCISSDEKRRERRKKKKKRVHFADDAIKAVAENEKLTSEGNPTRELKSKKRQVRKLPANRMALYKGILRDRPQRMV
ncbi:hypothetical protein CKAN_00587300 [Cinnamomum micranthum f. kanehirae]|uniref:Uncharacterized protein n=1 Tax=Cinnamomum micranthum f. kanehirae TaxID=337451 RepID=A0A3S3MYN1_9MAGN|nr:hypothetical protein CKAN_00587300 [Cinnamomum micranthum f. kanehirae]